MAAVEVAIHAVLAPDHLSEVPYIGVLFVLAAVVMTAVAGGLWGRFQDWAWMIGSAVCAGMFVAFVVSRVAGLPDYHEAWTADGGLGLLSLPPELIFLGCAAYRLFAPLSATFEAAERSQAPATSHSTGEWGEVATG
jgi:hypothetical protein